MPVRPLGSPQPVDGEGYLVRDAGAERIGSQWQPLLREVVALYRARFAGDLHSVYLRGSVARGTAVAGVADLDSVAVVDRPPSLPGDLWVEAPWAEEAAGDLSERYPFCEDVEVVGASLSVTLHEPRGAFLRFLLATQSVCLHGEDLGARMPRYRPGPDTVFVLPQLSAILAETESALEAGEPVAPLCRWTMKSLLRAGLEAVIEHEAVYARDLWPCYEHFARAVPGGAAAMWRALELAVDPTDDPAVLREVVDQVVPWLGVRT